MESKKLFDQAMYAFSCGSVNDGRELLKRSADLKLPIAVLYYAEHLFREDKPKGLSYLVSAGEKGVTGALHRYVVLKVFFTKEKLDIDDLRLLHKEAMAGHLESVLILLNLVNKESGCEVYMNKLKTIDFALFKQLYPSSKSALVPLKRNLEGLFDYALKRWNEKFCKKPTLILSKLNLEIFQHVLTPLVCDYFIYRLSPNLQPSFVHDPVSGNAIQNQIRNSSIVNVEPDLLDWFSLELELQIESMTGKPRSKGESLNFICYEKEQEYKPHYDAIVGSGEQFDKIISDGGQRQQTAICYLNDSFVGGNTVFPKIGLTIKPTKGSVLIFDNIDINDKVIKESYHAGSPLIQGKKYIMTKWIRCANTTYGDVVYPQ